MSLSDSQGGGWCELNGASVIGKLGSSALMDAGPGLWTFENGLGVNVGSQVSPGGAGGGCMIQSRELR